MRFWTWHEGVRQLGRRRGWYENGPARLSWTRCNKITFLNRAKHDTAYGYTCNVRMEVSGTRWKGIITSHKTACCNYVWNFVKFYRVKDSQAGTRSSDLVPSYSAYMRSFFLLAWSCPELLPSQGYSVNQMLHISRYPLALLRTIKCYYNF